MLRQKRILGRRGSLPVYSSSYRGTVLVNVTGDNNYNGKERKCLELMRKDQSTPNHRTAEVKKTSLGQEG